MKGSIKVNNPNLIRLWWYRLGSATKTQICDTNTEIVGKARRHETLTSSEIEQLYYAELNEMCK